MPPDSLLHERGGFKAFVENFPQIGLLDEL